MGERKGRIVVLFNKQAGVCAYTGEEMTLSLGHRNTATIDHVVPKSIIGKAFKAWNEVAVSSWVNRKKSDMPLSDFIGLLARDGLEKEM